MAYRPIRLQQAMLYLSFYQRWRYFWVLPCRFHPHLLGHRRPSFREYVADLDEFVSRDELRGHWGVLMPQLGCSVFSQSQVVVKKFNVLGCLAGEVLAT